MSVKARFGTQRVKKNFFSLEDGDKVFRILPPLSELADSNPTLASLAAMDGADRWSAFHRIHFGYKNSEGKLRTFVSPEVKNNKSGMIEVSDAAKERLNTLNAKLEEAKKSGNKAIEEQLSSLVGFGGLYNLDSHHYMNVVDQQGNVGLLKIRHKAKLALDTLLKQLHADGIDPLSKDDGRFIVFTRSGTNRDTAFSVRVLKEKVKVEGHGTMEKDVVSRLEDSLLSRLSTEATGLNRVAKILTAEEVKRVVETSNLMTGISPYLDELFSSKGSEQSDNTAAAQAETETSQPVAAPVQAAPIAESAPAPAAVARVAPRVEPVKTQSQILSNMSQEEFLASLNGV